MSVLFSMILFLVIRVSLALPMGTPITDVPLLMISRLFVSTIANERMNENKDTNPPMHFLLQVLINFI